MFTKFSDYMFYLLVEPLKKGKKTLNQFYIFFEVIGKLFDDCKADLIFMREQSTILTCAGGLLEVYGQERKMPRLEAETMESYRKRLLYKWDIAEKAGTKRGIMNAINLLNYTGSYIELAKHTDPNKWAEFIIFLRISDKTTITDLAVLDEMVWQLKETYAVPNYGFDYGNKIMITDTTEVVFGEIRYPKCGTIRVGKYPRRQNENINKNWNK